MEKNKRDFLEDPEMNDTGDRCELCKFYIPLDSAVGSCRRYPPVTEKLNFWERVLGKFTYRTKYQHVAWCRRACGEYLIKGQRK